MEIVAINKENRREALRILNDHWGSPMMISRGKLYLASQLPGYFMMDGDRVSGMILYSPQGFECEITVLYSAPYNLAIEEALLAEMEQTAKAAGCKSAWITMGNDNTGAMKFYQTHGYCLTVARINVLDRYRLQKPEIPHLGRDGIPLRDELEFAKEL